MMTDEQTSRVLKLKELVAATATSPSGAPVEVREEVVALKTELRRDGTTARTLAKALGLHETTLCRWERERQPSPGKPRRASRRRKAGADASSFRVVQIATPPTPAPRAASPQIATATSRGLRVAHAPSGLVIDGLDVETLAALLRRMS